MEKVLIVDNDVDSLDALERVLRKEFKVFRAGNGFEAIHVLDREGEMALVISELSMPVVDGVEFLMGIMHAYPDTVRVVLTRSLDPDLLLAAVNDLKLFRYMVKPFNRDELLLVVRQGVESYRLAKGQKAYVPPTHIFQFPERQGDYLAIEIDERERRQQVEALVSSPFFQALAKSAVSEEEMTMGQRIRSPELDFLDDYQMPQVDFDLDLATSTGTDETRPQQEDETLFLIREFVASVQEEPTTALQTGETEIQVVAVEEEEIPLDKIEAVFEQLVEEETTPQSQEEDTALLIQEFVSQVAPKSKAGKDNTESPDTCRQAPAPSLPKQNPWPEPGSPGVTEDEQLLEEIDTLIQKLEQEEKTKGKKEKITLKKTDNPLDSPEFRELQRQSNALIARIIRSWG
ncbi:MAG: response regulator [Pseudanabaenaceae cyanobacterium SKYGB_i_bin29]|nr:response regulator [Pseudanabaenaceae cyanobacterium SKYG29]MDW8421847.1 response regulator [Pseudanabaenaceae cyanobacterium SKYGB_i_bin29]